MAGHFGKGVIRERKGCNIVSTFSEYAKHSYSSPTSCSLSKYYYINLLTLSQKLVLLPDLGTTEKHFWKFVVKYL